jgi:CheY-like chemotaxis protein
MARILVVDDSAVVRRMLGAILKAGGHEVAFACDGQEGLATVLAGPPDLVLTDLEMPNMDGPTMVRRVRADAAGGGPPIVMMTASPEMEHESIVRDLKIDGFATKPLRSSEVLALISGLLEPGAS